LLSKWHFAKGNADGASKVPREDCWGYLG
jgi:hypothetical protein